MTSDIFKLQSAINEDLEILDNWLKGNRLSLNVAKRKSMFICTKSRRKILNSNDDKLNLLICLGNLWCHCNESPSKISKQSC